MPVKKHLHDVKLRKLRADVVDALEVVAELVQGEKE